MFDRTGATAADFMTSRVHTVRPEDPVIDATRMLVKRGFSGAPVVDEDRHLVGMLSEKDCIVALMNSVHHGLPPSTVADVMTREVITVTEETGLMAMAHLFVSRGLRRVPVVRGDKLVGQVSRRDLLARAVRIFEKAPDRQAAVLYLSALGRRPPV